MKAYWGDVRTNKRSGIIHTSVFIWMYKERWKLLTKFCLENLKGRPTRKARRRCEDNIRMDLKEIVWEGVD
jgi:hypothetical protein